MGPNVEQWTGSENHSCYTDTLRVESTRQIRTMGLQQTRLNNSVKEGGRVLVPRCYIRRPDRSQP
jgi:hypothetical protein